MKICELCGTEFPYHIRIEGKSRNLCNRKYCLTCSPFGRHNTRALGRTVQLSCLNCGESNPAEFTKKPDSHNGLYPHCKNCISRHRNSKARLCKRQCVDYKGGCCELCGYDKCLGALSFHHIDPSHKRFSISRRSNHSISKALKRELDKCLLVCENCHRELHYSKEEGEGDLT